MILCQSWNLPQGRQSNHIIPDVTLSAKVARFYTPLHVGTREKLGSLYPVFKQVIGRNCLIGLTRGPRLRVLPITNHPGSCQYTHTTILCVQLWGISSTRTRKSHPFWGPSSQRSYSHTADNQTAHSGSRQG